MEKRIQDLSELKKYLTKVENDISMVLQSLQWTQKNVLQGVNKVVCSHNSNHKIPRVSKINHENQCLLRKWGYSRNDKFLPEPVYPESKACVKFSREEIQKIINNASKMDPLFKKGVRSASPEPLTHCRLQSTYTADERRSLYDAVIAAVPMPVEDFDTLITSGKEESQDETKPKSLHQLLAEQRDMKRRRTKYRVATKSKNYSQVLKEVIRNQMEMYCETQKAMKGQTKKETDVSEKIQHSIKDDLDTESKSSTSDQYSKREQYNKYNDYNQKDNYYSKAKERKQDFNDTYKRRETPDQYHSRNEARYVDSKKETNSYYDHKKQRYDEPPSHSYKKYNDNRDRRNDKMFTHKSKEFNRKSASISECDEERYVNKRRNEDNYHKRYSKDSYDDKYVKVKRRKEDHIKKESKHTDSYDSRERNKYSYDKYARY